jgi:hypothetical protein
VRQVDANEFPNRSTVVGRILDSLIRKTEELLGDGHARHARHADSTWSAPTK